MLLESISSFTELWDYFFKQELQEVVDHVDHVAALRLDNTHHRHKGKTNVHEFDYKTWARKTAHYSESKITEDMHLVAKTTQLAFK